MSLDELNYNEEDFDMEMAIDLDNIQVGNASVIISRRPDAAVSALSTSKQRSSSQNQGNGSANTAQTNKATAAAAVVVNSVKAAPPSSVPSRRASAFSEFNTDHYLEEKKSADSPQRNTLTPPNPTSASLPITPPQSPKQQRLTAPKTPPPAVSSVAPKTPPKEAPRATARVISQAPLEEQFRYSAPPPKTYPSPTRNTQSPTRTMRSSTHSANSSHSPRRSRYDSSPFKSMRSSPNKYDRSPAKSLRGPPRSPRSSSRSVFSLPAPPPMPFTRDGMSFATSDSEFPLEEIKAEKSNMRAWFCFLIVGVLFLLAIVGTVVGLAIRHVNNKNNAPAQVIVFVPETAPPVEKTTLAPVGPSPTQSPVSPPPTLFPTYGDGFKPKFPEIFTRLSTFFTNDQGASIRVEGTPQNRAYRWLEDDLTVLRDEPLLDTRSVQRYALAVFYYSTNGDAWTRGENWLSASDECLWQTDVTDGTNCNGNTNLRAISQLVFDKNNIGGTLPPELSFLTHLEILSIINEPTGSTKIKGTIPPDLGKLTSIREFVLKNQDMSNATIPASLFLDWPRATLVLMERCKLIGRIPTTIGLLQSATKASFRKNELTGPIPTEVGEMRRMLQFSVDANRLTGTIPTEIGLMTDARGIWLNINQLSGPIPNELGRLTLMRAGLRLADNELTGTIPSSLGGLTEMRNLELQNNLLTGPVPEFGALINLKSLFNIRDNDLTGSVSEATCAAIVAGGAEAYADCPNEVSCACCLNCPV